MPRHPATTSSAAEPGPRDRLLASARVLTYEQGINVGVDAILEHANVARRSLYQHFGGKDALIAAMLRASAETDERRYRDALESGGQDPHARLLAVFETLNDATTAKRFRGCRYTAAELSLPDPEHPAHAEVRAYKQRLHDLFERELVALGHPAPSVAADELLLLIDGALINAVTRPDTQPAQPALRLAELVINEGELRAKRASA
jgi:AcrR family transcriptional regulator